MEAEETIDTGGAASSSAPASTPAAGPPPPSPPVVTSASPQPTPAPERKRPSTAADTDLDRRARVAASVLYEAERPVQEPNDLSDDHFDYEEGGIDPALLAEAKEKALQQLEEFGVYEIAPKESTLGSLFDLQVGPLASSSPWKLRSDLWPIR